MTNSNFDEEEKLLVEEIDHGVCYLCSNKEGKYCTGTSCFYKCEHKTDYDTQYELCLEKENFNKDKFNRVYHLSNICFQDIVDIFLDSDVNDNYDDNENYDLIKYLLGYDIKFKIAKELYFPENKPGVVIISNRYKSIKWNGKRFL